MDRGCSGRTIQGDGGSSVWGQQGCTELCPGRDDGTAQNLQVQISRSNNVGVFEQGACYCQPDQEEQTNPAAASWEMSHVCNPWSSQGPPTTLIPAGNNTTQHKGSGRFLQHRVGEFLTWVVEEPTKWDTLTDLIRTNIKVVGRLSYSDHELWNSGSWEVGEVPRLVSHISISTSEQILSFSKTYLEESHGTWLGTDEQSLKAGWFSRSPPPSLRMVQPDKQESNQKWWRGLMDKQEEQGSFIPTEGVGQRTSKQTVHVQILGSEGIWRNRTMERRFWALSSPFTFFVTCEFSFFLPKRKMYWKLIYFSQYNHFSNLANTFYSWGW